MSFSAFVRRKFPLCYCVHEVSAPWLLLGSSGAAFAPRPKRDFCETMSHEHSQLITAVEVLLNTHLEGVAKRLDAVIERLDTMRSPCAFDMPSGHIAQGRGKGKAKPGGSLLGARDDAIPQADNNNEVVRAFDVTSLVAQGDAGAFLLPGTSESADALLLPDISESAAGTRVPSSHASSMECVEGGDWPRRALCPQMEDDGVIVGVRLISKLMQDLVKQVAEDGGDVKQKLLLQAASGNMSTMTPQSLTPQCAGQAYDNILEFRHLCSAKCEGIGIRVSLLIREVLVLKICQQAHDRHRLRGCV